MLAIQIAPGRWRSGGAFSSRIASFKIPPALTEVLDKIAASAAEMGTRTARAHCELTLKGTAQLVQMPPAAIRFHKFQRPLLMAIAH